MPYVLFHVFLASIDSALSDLKAHLRRLVVHEVAECWMTALAALAAHESLATLLLLMLLLLLLLLLAVSISAMWLRGGLRRRG
jgi:hypothetical protein